MISQLISCGESSLVLLARGKPLLRRPWEMVNEPKRLDQTQPIVLTVMTYNVLAQSLVDKNMSVSSIEVVTFTIN